MTKYENIGCKYKTDNYFTKQVVDAYRKTHKSFKSVNYYTCCSKVNYPIVWSTDVCESHFGDDILHVIPKNKVCKCQGKSCD